MAANAISKEADDERLHFVFRNNPINLRSFVHKCVKIVTNDKAEHTGYVYTIDPVTGSYIIVKPSLDNSLEETLIEVIPGCAIQDAIVIEEKIPLLKDPSTIDSLFSSQSPTNLDPSFVSQQRLKIMKWFQRNFIPIQQCKDDPDSLIIMNTLKVMPPYGVNNCYTDNEMVLGKIQGLLKAMPQDLSDD